MSSSRPGSVRLRPFRAEDVEQFASTFVSPEDWGEFEFFGFSSHQWLREAFARDGFLGKDFCALTVEADGQWAGRVSWWRSAYGPQPSVAVRFAVIIDPGQRGRGIGTSAQQLLVEYLFNHTGCHRIEALADARNVVELTALERCGFVREGTVRGSMWSHGSWHDLVLHGLLRQDHQQ
jgi:RimJ/RimL family protein N-acetyltransferase